MLFISRNCANRGNIPLTPSHHPAGRCVQTCKPKSIQAKFSLLSPKTLRTGRGLARLIHHPQPPVVTKLPPRDVTSHETRKTNRNEIDFDDIPVITASHTPSKATKTPWRLASAPGITWVRYSSTNVTRDVSP